MVYPDEDVSNARFGFAINPLSLLNLLLVGEPEGAISLEFTASSRDRRFELALPVYYVNRDYQDYEYYRVAGGAPRYRQLSADLVLRIFPLPERSRLYLGPVLRHQTYAGYPENWRSTDAASAGERAPKIRSTRLGAGVVIGFGHQWQGKRLIPGLYYWGVSFAAGKFIDGKRTRVEHPSELLEPSLGAPREDDEFYDLTFFRWGVVF